MSYTFYLTYFSEVSAEITVRVGDNRVRMCATHTTDAVPIDDWFHFSGSYSGPDPLCVEGSGAHRVLHELGDQLYPGARMLLEQDENVSEPRKQFFTDLYFAFVFGNWCPAGKAHPSGYEHEVGVKFRE